MVTGEGRAVDDAVLGAPSTDAQPLQQSDAQSINAMLVATRKVQVVQNAQMHPRSRLANSLTT